MINTLKGIDVINGKPVFHKEFVEQGYSSREESIVVDHTKDEVSFKMLTEPASEGGDLGRCQLTDLVIVALIQLRYLNEKFPCRENAMTITKLDEALMWQTKRTTDRLDRGVEGRNEK